MSGTRRVGLTVLVVAGLLVAVAVAAGGGTDTGSGGARRPAEWLVDVAVSLLLVQLAVGAVLTVIVLVLRPQEVLGPSQRATARRGRGVVLSLVVIALLLLLLGARRMLDNDGRGVTGDLLNGTGTAGDVLGAADDAYEPQFAPAPTVAILLLLAVAVAAWVVARRTRRKTDDVGALLEAALADALDEGVDDLEAMTDPRAAVIAAYARLERVLAAHGVPREPSEAPDEYLERVLATLELSRRAATRLTALFQTARFSVHDVDAGMKAEAISALSDARDELRALQAKREADRAEARRLAASAAR